MKHPGRILFGDDSGDDLDVVLEVDDTHLYISSAGERLGSWCLADVITSREVADRFVLDLGDEEVHFIADDPMVFAYSGMEAMKVGWAKFRSAALVKRQIAIQAARRRSQPSRLQQARRALVAVPTPDPAPGSIFDVFSDPDVNTLAPKPAPRPAPEPVRIETPADPATATETAPPTPTLPGAEHALAEQPLPEPALPEIALPEPALPEIALPEPALPEIALPEPASVEAASRPLLEVAVEPVEEAPMPWLRVTRDESVDVPPEERTSANGHRQANGTTGGSSEHERPMPGEATPEPTSAWYEEAPVDLPEPVIRFNPLDLNEPDESLAVDIRDESTADESFGTRSGGLLSSVKSALTRSKDEHVHTLVTSRTAVGLTRKVCIECGYVSIGSDD